MFEPALVALTSTPSIVASSAELTRPDSAATGACAEAANANDTAKAEPKAKPAAARSGCMGSSRTFLVAASIGVAACARQARHPPTALLDGIVGRLSMPARALANGRVIAGGFAGAAGTADHEFTLELRLVVLIRRLLLFPVVLGLRS